MMANEDEVAKMANLRANFEQVLREFNFLKKKQEKSLLLAEEEKQVQLLINHTKPFLASIMQLMLSNKSHIELDIVQGRIFRKLSDLQNQVVNNMTTCASMQVRSRHTPTSTIEAANRIRYKKLPNFNTESLDKTSHMQFR